MNTLPESILRYAQSLPEGGVVSPKEFLHLGSREAVDQALSRLVKAGKLLRVGRGLYAPPIHSRFGTRPPAPAEVVKALAERSGEVVTTHGASTANALGLTQQVPVQEVYLTSGRTRKLRLGKAEVAVKHAPRWMLLMANRPAGAAVRALAWMGQANASEAVKELHRKLPDEEWRALVATRSELPSWMATVIGREAQHG